MIDEDREALVDQRLVMRAVCGEALFQERAGAVPDHVANRCLRHRRIAKFGQRMIERRGKIGRSIERGSVEIEHDD